MGHYIANTRDELFNLFEVFKLEEVLASGEFGELDKTDVTDMIQEVANLAAGPIAESYIDSDRNPPVYDPKTFSVTLPDSFKKSVKAFLESGWNTLGLSEELGGTEVPCTVVWACNEMILGANPALHMYSGGAAFAQILYNIGNDEQKEWAKKIAEANTWGTTMVLTEPDAGSDVGAGRTKAVKQSDGTWHIEGVKRFITSGDSDDMFENIFHLVLARPEGAGPGTKGLSLFFVPKFLYDFDKDEKGERNGVFVTNVEHKMGLKVSATCEVTFGGHGKPAVGYLVGDGSLNQGIRQMFEVIENARMMVGTKSIAQLSTGYLNALAYAKERVQGADMADMMNKTAPRVTIIQHPDVRRSLQTQKAYAEGLRGLYLLAATYQNDVSAKIFSGADADLARKVNDFLLPLVKGVGSEQGYAKLTEALQTFGGSGFLQDYPLEQYIRDSKIDSLYEGTTAIQSLDFIFRKIVRDQAAAFNHILDQVTAFANSDQGGDKLKEDRELLSQALTDYRSGFDTLSGYLLGAQSDPQNIYRIGLVSVRFLLATGDLLVGWLLQLQAAAAIKALEAGASGADKDYYEGKIATANFFARTFLPDLAQAKYVIEQVDPSIMQLPVSAF